MTGYLLGGPANSTIKPDIPPLASRLNGPVLYSGNSLYLGEVYAEVDFKTVAGHEFFGFGPS